MAVLFLALSQTALCAESDVVCNEPHECAGSCAQVLKDGRTCEAARFDVWPKACDPVSVSRRLSDLLLSTDPAVYRPYGYDSESKASKKGYVGKPVHYAVVSLWVNGLECARLTGDKDRERALVKLFEPYYGEKSASLPKFKHVDFTVIGAVPLEIAVLTGDARARELGLRFADMQWEEPSPDDPPPPYNVMAIEERMNWWKRGYTCQTRLWIDDMYMINVLQGLAYRLTGERKYVDRAAKEMCLYLDEIQIKEGKDAGLFYHATDVPYVWGRGAGWMAAGMPIILELLPEDSECREKIMEGYLSMMRALLKTQCADGMWNQLVGDPKSWKETSATAMFGFGFAMGVKNGWLDRDTYGKAARKAYLAVLDRTDEYGNVRDVCCGTGKKNDYQYYLDRPHVHGDPHGQCALMWMCRAFLEINRRAQEKTRIDRPQLETEHWQKRIDAASEAGGGVVSIPEGRHLVGQLDLKSNVELHLEKGAILEGAVGMRHYRVTELPYSEGTWSSVVSAMNVTNVAVTGEGEIFGNGGAWPQPLSYGGNQEGTRPRGLVFGNVRGLRLLDFRLRDAACWGIVCKCCEDVEIRRVTVDSHANANNDGMDIEARNVVIADCDIDSGDDGVCLKSNHPEFVVENVLVTNVVSRSHCNALKIGTATHGTVRNVLFIDCRAAAPRREFIDRRPGKNNRRWYENEQLAGMSPGSRASESSGWSSIAVMNVDGGIVENVTYRNIVANGSKTPIFVRGGRRLKRSCGTPPSDKWIFRNVLIENVTGTALSSVPSSVTGVDGCRVDGCTLRNVHLKCRGLGAEESAKWLKKPVPENPGGYPEAHVFNHALPAWGLYARHVDGLRLENCTFVLLPGTMDSRQKIVLDDVK